MTNISMEKKKCSQCRYCRVRVAVQASTMVLVAAVVTILSVTDIFGV
jgi:hypothetical protein